MAAEQETFRSFRIKEYNATQSIYNAWIYNLQKYIRREKEKEELGYFFTSK